ncbi:hypothetical protein LZ519_09310 [Sphingomonas sp. RG327]|uniref:Uncharacterized protein n=1 Tax=Sphingomonas anseongensis TaxID=2908207 RepID=A0ABT0RGV6_9SPHN|nr:hypothetical protein [Sphingomonas anseongensis]MCL6679507.1 hypothetical protein [Sphingomonas anseongensis]
MLRVVPVLLLALSACGSQAPDRSGSSVTVTLPPPKPAPAPGFSSSVAQPVP